MNGPRYRYCSSNIHSFRISVSYTKYIGYKIIKEKKKKADNTESHTSTKVHEIHLTYTERSSKSFFKGNIFVYLLSLNIYHVNGNAIRG